MPEVGEKRNYKMLTQEWDGKRWVNVKKEKPTTYRGSRFTRPELAKEKPDESRGAGHTHNFSGGYTADQVNQEFRQTVGRDATQGEIDNWTKWGKGVGQISAQHNYNSKYTTQIHLKDGKRVDAGTEGAKLYIIHKDEDEFYKYYGTGANRMRFETHKDTVHLAPGQALQGIGKGSYEFNSSQVTEDSGFFNFLKQQGLDPNQYYVGEGVHKSGNFLAKDIFTNLSDLTGIKEIDEVGELVFDKWMPDELKFAYDPLGTWGNFLDEDWNAQGLEDMSETFGGDLEDWHRGQAYANVAVDVALTIATVGGWGAATAAKMGLTTTTNAARIAMRRANQIIGAGGEDADDFLIDAGAQIAARIVPGGAVAKTTASFAFQTAANKAKGMDWGDSAEEAAWSTVSSRTGGVSNLIRASVDEDYRNQLEENPNGWAMLALQTAADAYAFGQNVQNVYNDQGIASWGKAIAAGFGYGEYGWDFRIKPEAYTGNYVEAETGLVMRPSMVFPEEIPSAQGLQGPPTVYPERLTGWDAFKHNMGQSIGRATQNFTDAFLATTPFGLLRSPSTSPRGQFQRAEEKRAAVGPMEFMRLQQSRKNVPTGFGL